MSAAWGRCAFCALQRRPHRLLSERPVHADSKKAGFFFGRERGMWRAFFLAVGISLCIWGAECLVIEKAILNGEAPPPDPSNNFAAFVSQPVRPAARELTPPEWAPWSLMSSGAVVILYSFTLPRRVAAG
jgi:hypothetical protein